jgi:hypothetical protein
MGHATLEVTAIYATALGAEELAGGAAERGNAYNHAIGALSSAEPHGVLNAGAVETKVAEHPIIQRAHLRHGPTDAVGIDNRPHQPHPPGGADNGLGRTDVLRRVLDQQAEHDQLLRLSP